MRVTFDPDADAAYIYLTRFGEVARTVPLVDLEEGSSFELIVDLDRDGRIVGIEVQLAGGRLPPELLRGAKRPPWFVRAIVAARSFRDRG
jgi:uncharacterized protein YuzE